MSGVEQLQTLVMAIEQMSVDSSMYAKLLQHLQAHEQVLIQNLPQLDSVLNCAETLMSRVVYWVDFGRLVWLLWRPGCSSEHGLAASEPVLSGTEARLQCAAVPVQTAPHPAPLVYRLDELLPVLDPRQHTLGMVFIL